MRISGLHRFTRILFGFVGLLPLLVIVLNAAVGAAIELLAGFWGTLIGVSAMTMGGFLERASKRERKNERKLPRPSFALTGLASLSCFGLGCHRSLQILTGVLLPDLADFTLFVPGNSLVLDSPWGMIAVGCLNLSGALWEAVQLVRAHARTYGGYKHLGNSASESTMLLGVQAMGMIMAGETTLATVVMPLILLEVAVWRLSQRQGTAFALQSCARPIKTAKDAEAAFLKYLSTTGRRYKQVTLAGHLLAYNVREEGAEFVFVDTMEDTVMASLPRRRLWEPRLILVGNHATRSQFAAIQGNVNIVLYAIAERQKSTLIGCASLENVMRYCGIDFCVASTQHASHRHEGLGDAGIASIGKAEQPRV